MIRQTLLFNILIPLIVIGQENYGDIVSFLVDGTQQKTNITCFCTEDEQCDSSNRTCSITHPDHACYESWTKEPDSNAIILTAGCILNDFLFTQILCNGNQTDRYIICCSDKHKCNDRDAYSGEIRRQLSLLNKRTPDNLILKLTLIIVFSCILLFSFLIAFILFRIKRNRNNSSNVNVSNEPRRNQTLLNYLCPRSPRSASNDKIDESSRSSDGYGVPLLAPYTFAKQIKLDQKIGVGGYGCVYRGSWHGDVIAVKIFLSSEDASWRREVFIYEEVGLNHENILRYIAADNIDVSNRIELWLATEYHENGSVYDYLMNHTVTIPIMLKMMISIANGLSYLHLAIDATNGKVALAHRDLKTKNILVKRDLSCCIADLGLAVREVRQIRNDLSANNNDTKEYIVIDINANHRVGTIRYMAPEILNKTLNDQNFESYKAADLYALGLVFWEILRRCQTTFEKNDADAYQLPYEDALPNNPTYDQMCEVVCVKKLRPSPSSRWENHLIFNYIFALCQELWTEKPACRPSSYHIKEQLKKRSESIDDELLNKNIESRNEGPLTI